MEYKKSLTNNITKDYKKTEVLELEKINQEAANTARKLQIDDRVDALGLNQGFITVKDHKAIFPNRLDCRLINPYKSTPVLTGTC